MASHRDALQFIAVLFTPSETLIHWRVITGATAADVKPTRASALRKITCRLIPFLFVLYVVAWLDRVNVGFAALQMNADLKFSDAAFGFGSGVFFIGYCLFEVPSNLILARLGARIWISRIMISWGLVYRQLSSGSSYSFT